MKMIFQILVKAPYNGHIRSKALIMTRSLLKTVAFAVSAALLLPSCATLISGTSQKVQLNSNGDQVRVMIDDETEAMTGSSVKLRRKKDHTIKVVEEGYEETTYNLGRRTNPAVWGNLSLFPVALVTGIVLASQKESYSEDWGSGYIYTGTRPIEPQATIGIWTAAFSYLAPLLPFTVDAINGAMYKFDDEADLDIVKKPQPFDPEKVIALQVEKVNVKLDPGTKIGSIHNKRGTPYSDLNWEHSMNVSFEDLQVQANNDLNEQGLNIPGLRNLNEEMVQHGKASYLVEAEIKKLDYDIYTVALAQYRTTTTLETTWRLMHPRTQKVIYHKTITTSAEVQENGGATPVYRALRKSAYELMRDEEFRGLMARSSSTPSAAAVAENKSESGSIALSSDERTKTKTVAKIAASSKDAVVTILTNGGHGSGFMVSADGYILTNAHVVEGFDDIQVKFSSGLSLPPEVIKIDAEVDVALLKVPGSGYGSLTMTDQVPDLGEEVVVIGTPAKEDLSQSISRGVVSGVRLIEGRKMIQTDAGISPGNSGGPMLDNFGQVIGIVTSKISGGGVEGIGFGIPSSEVFKAAGIEFR